MMRARVFSALLGFALAVAGLYFDNRQLIWASMVVLAAALALRLWSRRKAVPPPGTDD